MKLFSDASSDLTNSFKNNQQSVGKLQPIEQTTTLATTTTTIITTGSIQESEEERTTSIADKLNNKNHKINPSIDKRVVEKNDEKNVNIDETAEEVNDGEKEKVLDETFSRALHIFSQNMFVEVNNIFWFLKELRYKLY